MSIDTLSGLAQTYMNNGTSRGGDDQLKKLAQQFESVFLTQLMSVMRENGGEGGFFEGTTGSDLYMSMMDQGLAQALSEKGGLGLAEPLYEYLKGKAGVRVPKTDPEAPIPPTLAPQTKTESNDIIAVLRSQLSKYRVSSEVGWRRDPISGERRFHKGTDFAIPEGTPVPSATRGKVVFSGDQGEFGQTVVIENKQGQRIRYAHLSRLNVQEGQEVKQGQNIGAVGSTGRSTGAHLHVEVEKDGRLTNPIRYRYSKNL
jgi:murein DD-endopeptidase MepM/ murein hydrolase activator NlpD